MKNPYKFIFVIISFVISLALLIFYFLRTDIAILSPKGVVGSAEKDLMVNATGLMFLVMIPVFILMLFVIWKYRASNSKATYTPYWDNNIWIEMIWWAVPLIIVAILSVMTWKSCHALNPFAPLSSDKKPIRIQVVALQWKWFFIYPEYEIATVNYIQFPKDVPINFEITSDAPMNSFWIPRLGGQIYAMPGMVSKLHLMASEEGVFPGSSAHISGNGFAGMRFEVKATTEEEFDDWLQSIQENAPSLNMKTYNNLALPSQYDPPAFYTLKVDDLFDQIVMKYMIPKGH
jgi:cytochrome o ubiquinol oxidase subunit 2